MNSVRLNNPSLKYQRFTSTGCRDIGIRKFEFVAKTQILWMIKLPIRLSWILFFIPPSPQLPTSLGEYSKLVGFTLRRIYYILYNDELQTEYLPGSVRINIFNKPENPDYPIQIIFCTYTLYWTKCCSLCFTVKTVKSETEWRPVAIVNLFP